jgi:MYXO-CTERM domain-containing protein
VNGEGGMNVTDISDGDYIKVKEVEFGAGATSFDARVAAASGGGAIELRLDRIDGTLIATCPVASTGGNQTWAAQSCAVTGATAKHDLFLRFTGSGFKFDWWQFTGPGAPGTGGAGGQGGIGAGGALVAGGTAGTGGIAGGGGTQPGGAAQAGGNAGAGGRAPSGGAAAVGGSVSTGGAVPTGGGAIGTGGASAGSGAVSGAGGATSGGSSAGGAIPTAAAAGGPKSDESCGCRVVGAGSKRSSIDAFALLGLLAAVRSARRRLNRRRLQ